MSFNKGINRGLEGMPEPELGSNHDDKFGELHEFAVRAFTWKTKPEDLALLDTIEHVVDDFMKDYIDPSEHNKEHVKDLAMKQAKSSVADKASTAAQNALLHK